MILLTGFFSLELQQIFLFFEANIRLLFISSILYFRLAFFIECRIIPFRQAFIPLR
jgi:hypothetical protein